MPPRVTIQRPERPLSCTIALPPGKSVANRALVLAALAGDLDRIKHFGQADDTRILHRLLRGRPSEMHCGEGGTTFRFLLAWACVQAGEEHLITGNQRLLQRPHAALVRALRQLGAEIAEKANGFRVRGKQMRGGAVTLDSPQSSQFISALLLIASGFTEGMRLQWTGTQLSRPYVDMTVRLCQRFGASIREEGNVLHVAPRPLKGVPIQVPGDWSAAAFWYQVAGLSTGSEIILKGMEADGLQGDEAVAQLLEGVVESMPTSQGMRLRGMPGSDGPFTADLVRTPDLFQPLAFTMAGLGRTATFIGLHNLPLKETDRLQAVAKALSALGCPANYAAGSFHLKGPITVPAPPPFNPQGDHRMAMGLAPLALVCDAVTILHPEVVTKSYPGFWEDLGKAGFIVRRT